MIVYLTQNDSVIPVGAIGKIIEESKDKNYVYVEFDLTGMALLWDDSGNPIVVTREVKRSDVAEFVPVPIHLVEGDSVEVVGIMPKIKLEVKNAYLRFVGSVGVVTSIDAEHGVVVLAYEEHDMPFPAQYVLFQKVFA